MVFILVIVMSMFFRPYIRVAVQWCKEPTPDMLEYAGVWIEPTAFSVDPLLVAWLGYRPKLKIVPTGVIYYYSDTEKARLLYVRARVRNLAKY